MVGFAGGKVGVILKMRWEGKPSWTSMLLMVGCPWRVTNERGINAVGAPFICTPHDPGISPCKIAPPRDHLQHISCFSYFSVLCLTSLPVLLATAMLLRVCLHAFLGLIPLLRMDYIGWLIELGFDFLRFWVMSLKNENFRYDLEQNIWNKIDQNLNKLWNYEIEHNWDKF